MKKFSSLKCEKFFIRGKPRQHGAKWIRPKESEWWGYIEPISKYHLWKPRPDPITHNPESGWTLNSRRVGVLAKKLGMSGDWNEWGQRLPLTFLQIERGQVVAYKTQEKHGFDAIVMGFIDAKDKHIKKPQQGMFVANGVPFKKKLAEFPVSPDCHLPLGTHIDCRHFIPGQKVDIQGITKGKGFQGGMKRWGFGGGRASHGNSLAHRTLGSTGSNQSPGKVWKGKKMAGRMGGKKSTMKNLFVFSIAPERNVVVVVGSVPGSKGSFVRITDARNPRNHWPAFPPYPCYQPKPGENFERKFAKMPLPPEAKQAIREGYDVQKILLDDVYKDFGGYNVDYPTFDL